MIIEKKYNFDKSPEEKSFYTLREYHNTILTDIIRQGHAFMKNDVFDHVIFVGIDGASMIQDSGGFTYSNILSYRKDKYRYSACIGLLMGRNVYYDLRLEWNQVILGSTASEVNQHITTKGRKEKLIKLKELNEI